MIRAPAIWYAAIFFIPGASLAQLTTGAIEGTIRGADDQPVAHAQIVFTGAAGFRAVTRANDNGEFTITLPYGEYGLFGNLQNGERSNTVFVAPWQTVRVRLARDTSGVLRILDSEPVRMPGVWADRAGGLRYPGALSLPGLLLSREPTTVTQPLNFTGLEDNRLAIQSQRGLSWTDTQYKLQGMDATDSYQPGRPVMLPDVEALDEIVVRSAFAQTVSSTQGGATGVFLAAPRASWHGAISTFDSGDALASTNLPAPANRGLVQQPSKFRWLTSDHLEAGGPLTRRVDLFASSSGQWSSQTEPLASPGINQRSRLLYGNARGRVAVTARDQLDALYSGSRINLTDGGMPAGIEALTSNRMAPSFILPGGFPGQPEVDHLDFLQVGWTHLMPADSRFGSIELRYGYSTGHLDTNTALSGQSRVELLGGAISGAPPLANLAVRPRHEIEAIWQPSTLNAVRPRHHILAGGGWQTSTPRNRFSAPSGMNLVTVSSAPAYITEFNTPANTRELIRSFSGYLSDHISLAPSLTFELAAQADFSRGSLPVQSSPAGPFAPARAFAPQPDLIVWNSVSPRSGFAWQVPRLRGLIIRGAYFRLYSPLAGRDLDFGNPASLGGSVYQWIASNPVGSFQPGGLLLRFGGPYSSISPSLRRPHSDEFDVGAEFPLARRSFARIHLFRRDTKDRLALLDTGVPMQAFTPVSITDPGPDGIYGTFDDRPLTVYAQSAASLGQDRYLLTNPAGLRMLNTGVAAEAGADWRGLTIHASFTAERSYGPTNPGDAPYENDPGVIGALFLDPNTVINAAGRIFMDRAYIGKLQAAYRLPRALGGIEVATVADYMDGLVFARQLLVTGLPQGPFLVASTVRGSPNGGNRAEYAINWNIRVSRNFELPMGNLTFVADLLNLTNAGQRLQENDLSGPSFNLRLPIALQPPRFLRAGFRYEF